MKSILATLVVLGALVGAANATTLAQDLFTTADQTAKTSPFFDQIDRDMKLVPGPRYDEK